MPPDLVLDKSLLSETCGRVSVRFDSAGLLQTDKYSQKPKLARGAGRFWRWLGCVGSKG